MKSTVAFFAILFHLTACGTATAPDTAQATDSQELAFSDLSSDRSLGAESESLSTEPVDIAEHLSSAEELKMQQLIDAFFRGDQEAHYPLHVELFGSEPNYEPSSSTSPGMCDGEGEPCEWLDECFDEDGDGEPPGDICDTYSPSHTYMGTYMRCFCNEAGTTDWSNHVRECIQCAHWDKGICDDEAHDCCYDAADDAGFDKPWLDLAGAYASCFF